MNGGNLYLAGVPVNPSVSALLARWPALKPGDEIDYADVSAVAQIKPATARWVTVTNRWRAYLIRERGVRLGCIGGRAFVVLDDKRLIDGAANYIKRGTRSFATGIQWAGAAKPEALDDVGRRRRDHMLTQGAKLLATAQKGVAELDETNTLPRPSREQRKLKE